MHIISGLVVIALLSGGTIQNLPDNLRQESNFFQALFPQIRQHETWSLAQAKPNIVSRQAWGAKDPVGEMKRHTPSHVTVHHTASLQKRRASLEEKMRSLQAFSQSAGTLAGGKRKPVWPDVPYHFYISVDGRIAEARDINFVGDTNTDYDPTGHVLIVLEGNFEKEQASAHQLRALKELSLWLAVTWKIPASEIKGHRDYASTACPGKNLENELPRLRKSLAEAMKE